MPLQPDYYTERIILTAILNEKPVASMLFSMLSPHDFMAPLHATVFQYAKKLHADGQEFGTPEVWMAMKDKTPFQFLEISGITDLIPDAGNEVARYIPLVKQNRKRMNLVRLNDFLADQFLSETANTDVNALYETAAKTLHDGLLLNEGIGPTTLEIFNEHFRQMERTQEEVERSYLRVSDWYKLKDIIPFERQNLYGFAARPGVGKSAALLHIITRFAMIGWKGVYFSIEMNRTQVCNRIIANLNRFEKKKLRFGNTTPENRAVFRRSLSPVLKNVHVVLKEEVNSSVLASEMYSAKHNMNGLDYVVIDYLQIMDPGENKSRNRYQEIGNNCKDIRRLCKTMDVAGIIGIQVGRKVEEGKEIRKIHLSDMRESGDIENHLDGCVAMNLLERASGTDTIEFEVLKNREGELGSVKMEHVKNFSIIGEVDENI